MMLVNKTCMYNKYARYLLIILAVVSAWDKPLQGQTSPDQINFIRQGVRRLIFDEEHSIPLASLNPAEVIGFSSMHPVYHHLDNHARVSLDGDNLIIRSNDETQTGVWFGGFNPFATYSIDLGATDGDGKIGFEFSDTGKKEQFFITVEFHGDLVTGVWLKIFKDGAAQVDESVAINLDNEVKIGDRIILQMLGSGLVLYIHNTGLPRAIGQCDFNAYLDLRQKRCIQSFQSNLFVHLKGGGVTIREVKMAITTGVGLADIRAITYENGDPLLDQGRLWYTMSIRGRALPHHIQGVFSLDPTVFDIRLEGIVLFDRRDGLLRNEIASHIFYDREQKIWRGLTTGFSAYANRGKEKKQLLAIESTKDPRFGFSIMTAVPFGMVGDIEDPHILFDREAGKWRMLTCENKDGYKAIMLESDHWNRGFEKIAGPVVHNSTGTSIQKIGDRRYCFSGSSEREIFIYTYPGLEEAGTLKMDLPPWDETSRTRVWPNVVQLPEGYPIRYIALMMDRYNYPGLKGPHWSYGALYLYHGNDP